MNRTIPLTLAVLVALTVGGCAEGGRGADRRAGSGAEAAAMDYAAEFGAWRQSMKAAGTRWRDVMEEADALPDHPWAGDYYQGDGLGRNLYLSLAPRAGFVYEVRGCQGRYDQNLGRVEEVAPRRLRLEPELPQDQAAGVGGEYLLVRWGGRRYLVAPKELETFRRAIASGEEPRRRPHGRFLLGMSDHTRPAPGEPAWPATPDGGGGTP